MKEICQQKMEKTREKQVLLQENEKIMEGNKKTGVNQLVLLQ